jgi:flagellar basal body-associated protein FliL
VSDERDANSEPAPGGRRARGDGGKEAKDRQRKRRKRILLLVPVALLIAVAAKMTVLKAPAQPVCPPAALGGEGAAVDATAPPVDTQVQGDTTATAGEQCAPAEPGAVLVLDPITLNLADGRFLKVSLALQLASTADAPTMQAEGAGAKALDAAVDFLGSSGYEDLLDLQSRDEIKQTLTREIIGRYDDDSVIDVYFTELVMQ